MGLHRAYTESAIYWPLWKQSGETIFQLIFGFIELKLKTLRDPWEKHNVLTLWWKTEGKPYSN